MRQNLKIPGFAHKNPVPSGCRKGPLVMTGGIAGTDPETGELPPGAEDQCRNLFKHVRAIMAAAGGSVDDIVKMSFWLSPSVPRDILNKDWLEMFPNPDDRPTRHTQKRDVDDAYLVVGDLTAFVETKGG